MNSFSKQLQRLMIRSRTRDRKLTKQLIKAGVLPEQLRHANGSLQIRLFDDLTLHLPDERELLNGLPHLKALKSIGAVFRRDHASRFQIVVAGITLQPETTEELYILKEIFVDGCYNIASQSPAVVIDIGGNIGIAALHFAARDNVVAVHSFEPLQRNCERYARHLELNPQLAKKCFLHPFGLGEEATSLEVEFFSKNAGSFSISHKASEVAEIRLKRSTSLTKETIRIEAAGSSIGNILDRYPGIGLIAKVDCEGAEASILPAIARTGLLKQFRALVMETHFGLGKQMTALLIGSGFEVLHHQPLSEDLGYLLAFNLDPTIAAGKVDTAVA